MINVVFQDCFVCFFVSIQFNSLQSCCITYIICISSSIYQFFRPKTQQNKILPASNQLFASSLFYFIKEFQLPLEINFRPMFSVASK